MTSDSEFLLFIPCTFWTNIKHLRCLSGWSTVSCLLHFWPLSRFPSFMLICVLQITSDFLLKLHISKILCEVKLSPLCEMLYISFPETKVGHWCLWLDLPAHLRDRGHTEPTQAQPDGSGQESPLDSKKRTMGVTLRVPGRGPHQKATGQALMTDSTGCIWGWTQLPPWHPCAPNPACHTQP